MITNNDFEFYEEIFQVYSILSSKFIHCVKFDYLQKQQSYRGFSIPPNNFRVMKNVCSETPIV